MGMLRLILALSVVASHSTSIFGAPLLPPVVAVQCFFAISGFYMALILDGKYRDATTFYLNRFLRLYPSYLIVMVATLAWFHLSWAYIGREPNWSASATYHALTWTEKALLAFSNWTMIGLDVHSFVYRNGFELLTVGTAWSVGMELWFYLLAPWLVGRSVVLLVLTLLASAALRFYVDNSYYLAPAQLCFFIGGILLYRAYKQAILPKPPMWAAVGLLPLAALLAISVDTRIQHAAVIVAIPLLFRLTSSIRWDIAIGNLSYPIYLVHPLMNLAMFNVTNQILGHTVAPNGAFLALASIVAAICLYWLVERPVDDRRQRLAARNKYSVRAEIEQTPRVPAS